MPSIPTADDPSAARRELRVVSEPGSEGREQAGAAASGDAPSSPRRRSRIWPWLGITAALVFAWLWLTQLERSNALERDLSAAEQRLEAARAEVAAWQAHDRVVRDGVRDVVSSLAALEALLERAPAAAEAAESAPLEGGAASGDPETD